MGNPPVVCYKVGYYEFLVSLPASLNGYILSYQVNFRVDNMNNLVSGYNRVGATFAAEIPGNDDLAGAFENSSAKFGDNDLAIVCANNNFIYKFTATDADGDELRYQLCEAYRGGGRNDFASEPAPPDPPPYGAVPYGSGYSGAMPLGKNVSINAATGVISGIAPSSGTYVIAVCVSEYRNNILIAVQRKDFQITIAPCTLTSADLPSDYMLCKDSKTISLSNNSISPLINSYSWEIFNGHGSSVFTSNEPLLNYSFKDTGTYQVKLVINKDEKCTDSALTIARVYPGFVPGFNYKGICFGKSTLFKDITTSVYGNVINWNWYFDDGIAGDSSQNTSYTYPSIGTKNVQLVVANSVGCIDTIARGVPIVDKPPIHLAFRDTLICLNDAVQLSATGEGNFSWSPVVNMQNEQSPSPIVSPKTTTVYYVDLNSDDCHNRDSVTINVVDHVSLAVMNDSVVCSNDPVQLRTVSDALKFEWSPSEQVDRADVKSPVSYTKDTTTYKVIASIGSCSANASVTIKAVPYPYAFAGRDTVICYNTSAQLHAITNGTTVLWSPAVTLSNAAGQEPFAQPVTGTTAYVLTVYDTKGCPKPGLDTVLVTMLPDINAFAGRDTSVVVNQPLQLKATGGVSYVWSPATGLSSTTIADPVALHYEPTDGIKYKAIVYNEAGCKDSAYVTVKVFKTLPSVFVPGAFTPNGDGLNDFLRPIAAGMRQVEYFRIYNRWGQLLYNSVTQNRGWDGTINGKPQSAGVFVWMVKAIDYNGKGYVARGTVVLVR